MTLEIRGTKRKSEEEINPPAKVGRLYSDLVELPCELRVTILSFLSNRDLVRVAVTCKALFICVKTIGEGRYKKMGLESAHNSQRKLAFLSQAKWSQGLAFEEYKTQLTKSVYVGRTCRKFSRRANEYLQGFASTRHYFVALFANRIPRSTSQRWKIAVFSLEYETFGVHDFPEELYYDFHFSFETDEILVHTSNGFFVIDLLNYKKEEIKLAKDEIFKTEKWESASKSEDVFFETPSLKIFIERLQNEREALNLTVDHKTSRINPFKMECAIDYIHYTGNYFIGIRSYKYKKERKTTLHFTRIF